MILSVENPIFHNVHFESKPVIYEDCIFNPIDKVSDEKLKELADFSKTIEEPYQIGKFNNEKHYLKTLELVLNSTLETSNRILFFLKKILPLNFFKESLLDVGPGDGSLTHIFTKYFKTITAVDSNKYILNNLQKTFPSATQFIKINNSILDVELKSNSFNLAILSHILYYIDPKFWLKVVKSVYKSLAEHGILVIVMGGDELGKAALINHFGGKILEIDKLASKCRDLFGDNNVSLYASKEAFITCSKQAMFHISAFMLGDADISASRDKLNQYIEQNFCSRHDYFEMTTKQKFIVIRKNMHLKEDMYGYKRIFA